MPARQPELALRKVLTFWPMLFYGLGVIVGAGIYVALGMVMTRAGTAAPSAFLLAGIAAALTGLCYAELVCRFPEAAGAAAFVKHGFGSDLIAQIVGAAMTLATILSAASIAHGAVLYLAVLLPLSQQALVALLIVGFTAIAIMGIHESVGLAAVIGALEIIGLIVFIGAGLASATQFHVHELIPTSWASARGVIAGAFIAFFAFIGFETLANLAEEVKNPARDLPRGIIGSVAASTLLYVGVALAAVLSQRSAENPVLGLFEDRGAPIFAAFGSLAVSNGVLVEIVMLARLFYGMARNAQLPAILAWVHPRTRTPVYATITAGLLVLIAALFVPFDHLLVLADVITLGIFAMVDVALWRVHRSELSTAAPFVIPRWVPPTATVVALGLIAFEALNAWGIG